MLPAQGTPRFWTPAVERVQAAHRAHFEALYAGDTGVRTAAVCGSLFGASHGLWGTNTIDMLVRPEEWIADCLADMAAKAGTLADEVAFTPAYFEVDPFGTHFVDAVFGARVGFVEGQVWAEELPGEVGDLPRPDLDTNPALQAALRVAIRAAEVGGGRLLVSTPVLSCPINIGVNLFGQRLLVALLAAADDAHHALRLITDVILGCIGVFRGAIPAELLRTTCACSRYAPPGYGFIDGCATQLVSAEVYREFFAALDEEILAAWPQGGMLHLCGACAQHIPAWREMRSLRSVQLNDRATDDLELYIEGLRPDQILYVSPTAKYPPARVLEATRSRRLVMQWRPEPVTDA
jgi:hypothetical protein